MSNESTPTFKVIITPTFDSAGRISELSISLSIQRSTSQDGNFLLSFPSIVKTTLIASEQEPVEASDDHGPLPVVVENNEGFRWKTGRATSGDVKMTYIVHPLSAEDSGSPFDLRHDDGGVLGSGLSFIPVPQSAQVYRNIVEWDLSQAPTGTRAVWTFGEGPGPVERTGPASILSDSVYMVGPIHSNPPVPSLQTNSDYYGYYWFNTLPPNIEVIKDIHHAFFLKVSDFFQDPPSAINPYRSFVRRTSPANSFGGTAFTRSQIFDYDDQISQAHDYDLVRRMAYEMVQNFLGPSITEESTDWLYEGIKNTLSIYLPFRTGFRTPDYFQSTIQMLCMKYYTNPLIHLSHDELLKLASPNTYAIELLGARAWAFVMGTDYQARIMAEEKKTGMMRPIEDLAIKPIALEKRNGKPHGIELWVDLLRPLMGDAVNQRFEQMKSGSVILFPEKFFGPSTHRMQSVQQEVLDFGMDRESFEEGIVKGLKEGSRAEKAGLKEGIRIVSSSPVWRCVDDIDVEMELVVEQDGVETSLKYWPRAFERADGLQFMKLNE